MCTRAQHSSCITDVYVYGLITNKRTTRKRLNSRGKDLSTDYRVILTYIVARTVFQLSCSIGRIITSDKGCLSLMYSFSVTSSYLKPRGTTGTMSGGLKLQCIAVAIFSSCVSLVTRFSFTFWHHVLDEVGVCQLLPLSNSLRIRSYHSFCRIYLRDYQQRGLFKLAVECCPGTQDDKLHINSRITLHKLNSETETRTSPRCFCLKRKPLFSPSNSM